MAWDGGVSERDSRLYPRRESSLASLTAPGVQACGSRCLEGRGCSRLRPAGAERGGLGAPRPCCWGEGPGGWTLEAHLG